MVLYFISSAAVCCMNEIIIYYMACWFLNQKCADAVLLKHCDTHIFVILPEPTDVNITSVAFGICYYFPLYVTFLNSSLIEVY